MESTLGMLSWLSICCDGFVSMSDVPGLARGGGGLAYMWGGGIEWCREACDVILCDGIPCDVILCEVIPCVMFSGLSTGSRSSLMCDAIPGNELDEGAVRKEDTAFMGREEDMAVMGREEDMAVIG